jgi:uncharacterized membrane protein
LIQVSLEPESRSVSPGQRAEFIITAENTGTEPQAQSIELTGLPDAWYSISFDVSERALPGEKRSGRLVISVPSTINGGNYDFDVAVLSGSAESSASGSIAVSSALPEPQPEPARPEASSTAPSTAEAVSVMPVVTLEAGLVVWRGQGQQPERKVLTISNPGKVEADYQLTVEGLEPPWYTVLNRVRVGAGQQLQTDFTIHPPTGARQQDYPYRIYVSVEGRPDLRSEASGWLAIPGAGGVTAPAPAAVPEAPAVSATPPRPARPDGVSPPDVVLSPRSNFSFGRSEAVAQALVTVYNRSKVRERYRILINGIPEDWYRLSDSEVRLDPGENRQVSLRLAPVTGPSTPAGEYEFLVRAVPDGMEEYFGEALGVISITGVPKYEARLDPLEAEGTRKDYSLRVENTGDTTLRLTLDPSDPESRCKFKLPETRTVDPGQVGLLQLRVGAKRNGFVGPPETFDFRVRIDSEDPDVVTAKETFDGRFIHHPKVPYRTVFILGFVCALVGFVFLLVWLFSPTFERAGNWIGCQLDNEYRFSADTPGLRKESCDGEPREQQLEQWRRERQEEEAEEEDSSIGVSERDGLTLAYAPAPNAYARDG